MSILENMNLSKIEIELEAALTDLRVNTSGANVHRVANVLCKIQGVLTLMQRSHQKVFAEVILDLNGANLLLQNEITKALGDGVISPNEAIEIKKKIELLMKVARLIANLCEKIANGESLCD